MTNKSKEIESLFFKSLCSFKCYLRQLARRLFLVDDDPLLIDLLHLLGEQWLTQFDLHADLAADLLASAEDRKRVEYGALVEQHPQVDADVADQFVTSKEAARERGETEKG